MIFKNEQLEKLMVMGILFFFLRPTFAQEDLGRVVPEVEAHIKCPVLLSLINHNGSKYISDEEAVYKSVRESPNEDVARLVSADKLVEVGREHGGVRAEFLF